MFKIKMTKIYCSKCKAFTETENEDQDITKKGHYRLSGECTECGKGKCVFTDENYDFAIKKKSAKEKATAKIKRKEASLNRKAKKLGRQILDSDKKVKRNVRKYLRDSEKNDA